MKSKLLLIMLILLSISLAYAYTPLCQDGMDNDGDGRTDYPADPGCRHINDNDEDPDPVCGDRIDNDLDGKIDFPADNGCASIRDNKESRILGYAHGCLGGGDFLKTKDGTITYRCDYYPNTNVLCDICVLMTEFGNYTTNFWHCYDKPRCGFGDGSYGTGISGDSDDPVITVVSPQNDGIYRDRKTRLKIQLDEEVKLYYLDLNNQRRGLQALSSSYTQSYDKFKSIRDGEQNWIIYAYDRSGNEASYELNFFIDTKTPRIKGVEPRKGFASGIFDVEFAEDNPEQLVLKYGNYAKGYGEQELDLDECTTARKETQCSTTVDLSQYDNTDINYWFEIEDIAGNKDDSKIITVKVDQTDPVINNLGYAIDGKYVYFDIEITERNFDEISYLDTSEPRARWRRLCTRLRENRCQKRVSFREGYHNLNIQVIDEAGNSIAESVSFTTSR